MTTPWDNARPNLGKMSHETLVTLKVGSEAKRFLIHKDVLSKQSPYFRAALEEGRWKESQDNVVELDETEPKIFEDFLVEWLYTGKLDEDLAELTLIEGYIFADRYDFPRLRFDVIASIHGHYTEEMTDDLPSYDAIILAFESLPPRCKLCEFLVDLYGSRWKPYHDYINSRELELREQLPMAFLMRWLEKLGNRPYIGDGGLEHGLGHYSEQMEEVQSRASE
ncbi:Btb poz domain containing protein [Lasiodiplodia theobromae]|uniref:Btb poz domain containing protein n=1 Tax=Lasiodiplodia theobromae TaxID=45133 RepID=UPI0015C3968B|nr:Btb poz domain containing protein [Lasiodiplodia theobromae]KAF4538908.1 Btb poz domain containing protein [Lasiodiplodia theobromae]